MSPDTAFAAAQVLSVLLVATMFDPWTKRAMADQRTDRKWQVGAFASYGAKVLSLIVLLFDMQPVLFDNPWSGTQGLVLALANYVAIVAAALSILLTVLHHIGGLGERDQD